VLFHRQAVTGILLDGHWGVAVTGGSSRGVKALLKEAAPAFDQKGITAFVEKLPLRRKARAAVTLPLAFFDVLQLSFPPVPEEAMGAAVAYQLSRNLDGKLEDYVYDWVETGRDSRTVEVTAYLLNKSHFSLLKGLLAKRGYSLKYLEPDIFSAFAFIEKGLPEADEMKGPLLCALLWEDSFTLGIRSGGSVSVARSVALKQEEAVELEDEAVGTGSGPGGGEDDYSIFQEFGLASHEEVEETVVKGESDPMAEPRKRYREYLDAVVLEVVRTRDYFVSVLKRGKVGGVVLGGEQQIVADLKSLLQDSLETPILSLPEKVLDLPCTSAQGAVAVGSVLGR